MVTLAAADWDPVLEPGDPVLYFHIPGGIPLDHAACGDSFRAAMDFFPRHFPERPYRAFFCGSWLLDTQLEDWLPSGSNLVRFLREFYMVPSGISARSILQTVFGNDADDLSNAPRDTSLQRAILEHVSAGRPIDPRAGKCFLFPEDLDWGRQVYRTSKFPPASGRLLIGYTRRYHTATPSAAGRRKKRKEVDMERFGKLELDYLAEVIASGSLNSKTGKFTTRLEERFAAWVGAEYALAMNSAMSVLHTAVAAAGVGPGVEVVCDPVVHFGGAAVMYHNGVPVFCDIDEDSWNMDPDSLEACITEHTGAVICTPMWGNPPDYDGILRVADKYELPVIEDVAHGVGGSYRGTPLGTLGSIGSYSFQEAKHLTSGDGGMAVTDRADMVEKMQEMRIIKTTLGWNYRMTELQAGVMLAQMDRADGIISAHHKAGSLYREAARETPWLAPQRVADGCVNAYHAVAFRFEGDREGISVERFQEDHGRTRMSGLDRVQETLRRRRSDFHGGPGVRQRVPHPVPPLHGQCALRKGGDAGGRSRGAPHGRDANGRVYARKDRGVRGKDPRGVARAWVIDLRGIPVLDRFLHLGESAAATDRAPKSTDIAFPV